MRNFIILKILIVILSFNSYGQNIKVSDNDSFKAFVEQLTLSKDIKYQEVIKKYDDYIISHPEEISVKIYKCKFIGSAYYDGYEEYDLNWEKTTECIDNLYSEYPRNPEVLLYKLDDMYGDEKAVFFDQTLEVYNSNIQLWSDESKSEFFKIAAYHYSDIDPYETLNYADKAERYNKDLDLSLLAAQTHIELGNKAKAIEVLDIGLFYDHDVWTLQAKGELLIKLEEYDKAFEIFERVKTKDSTLIDNESIYKILLNGDKINLARSYLVKDTVYEWNKATSLQKLLTHDIKYSTKEIALISYEKLHEESYYNDFFGMKRIQIFLMNPFSNWSLLGISHFIFLYILIILLFVLPYLWVMPVYGLAKYFNWNFNVDRYWNLKHFWLISFLYLVIQTLLMLIFYYQDTLNLIFDLDNSYYDIDEELIVSPNEIIVFSSLMLVSTLAFLNKKSLKFVFRSTWTYLKMIGLGFLFFLFNIILIRFLGNFVDLTETINYFSVLNIRQEIFSLMNEKGILITILIVAVIVPFYEELIFRGILLNSVTKHLGFKSANIFQAFIFSAIHFNPALFPFYFTFGLITGYLVKRTKGLMAGVIFHSINNLIIVILLYYLSELITTIY